MSKGNLFLGQARGSVGDVTFTHTDGVQIARSRNRSPKNPQSVLQMVTRIVQSSVSKAYSLFLPICDHAFQGKATGTPNQSRFMQLNAAMLRAKLSDIIVAPSEEAAMASTAYNFSFKGDQLPVFNEWIVSAGTLPVVPVEYLSAALEFAVGPLLSVSNPLELTYQQVADALHAQQGDQLTILAIANDPNKIGDFSPTIDAFEYARIILEPSSGNMSAPFFTGETAPFSVNLPNERNEGSVAFGWNSSRITVTRLGTLSGSEGSGTARWIQGVAAILSRRVNTTWERSSQSFVVIRGGVSELNYGTFGDAYLTYLRAASASPLYLNQSGATTGAGTAGGALEWYNVSGSNKVAVSGNKVPVVAVAGRNCYFNTTDTTPSSTATVNVYSEYYEQVLAAGYTPVVIGEFESIDDTTRPQAVNLVNAWFNPQASLVPMILP